VTNNVNARFETYFADLTNAGDLARLATGTGS